MRWGPRIRHVELSLAGLPRLDTLGVLLLLGSGREEQLFVLARSEQPRSFLKHVTHVLGDALDAAQQPRIRLRDEGRQINLALG